MGVGYSDQYLEQGATFTTTLTLDDDTNSPMDLTGFSARSMARRSYSSANATIVFDTTIIDASNGVIQLAVDSATSANVPAGRLVYDVVIKELSSNVVTRVVEGIVYVSPAATY